MIGYESYLGKRDRIFSFFFVVVEIRYFVVVEIVYTWGTNLQLGRIDGAIIQ